MKVFWGELSNDDANGEIIKYEVCYKASEDLTDINRCNLSKTVDNGNTREAVLDKLNEATTYNVAVKAATSKGFGHLGAVNTSKTLEAGKRFFTIIINSMENLNLQEMVCNHVHCIFRNLLFLYLILT